MNSNEQARGSSIAFPKTRILVLNFLTQLTQLRKKLRDDLHLWEALRDLLKSYFPIILVAIFIYASGNAAVLLLGRSDLLLLTAVLFAEGGTTIRRDTSSHHVFGWIGFGTAVLLAGFALSYEFAVNKGIVPEAIISVVHRPEYQMAQVICVLLGLLYGLITRIAIYRDKGDEIKPDQTYDVVNAISFYDAIAADYNTNFKSSDKLVKTQDAVADQIDATLESVGSGSDGKRGKILDLGGGTGLLAQYYSSRRDIDWVACEPAARMRERYVELFRNRNLLKPRIESWDLDQATKELKDEKFDVIVLSFVLSSLEKLPKFAPLKSLLKESGILILADWDAIVGENNKVMSRSRLTIRLNKEPRETYELKLAQLNTWKLFHELGKAGFIININPILIPEDELVNYSFVTVCRNQ